MWVLECIVGALGAPGGVKLVGSVTFKVLRGFPKMSYAPRVSPCPLQSEKTFVRRTSHNMSQNSSQHAVTKRTTTAVKVTDPPGRRW